MEILSALTSAARAARGYLRTYPRIDPDLLRKLPNLRHLDISENPLASNVDALAQLEAQFPKLHIITAHVAPS